MTLLRTSIPTFILCACAVAAAQTTPDVAFPVPAKPKVKTPRTPKPNSGGQNYNTNLIVLDPAHGGSDNGARLGDNSFEKDATLAFAQKLRTLLQAQGFTVVFTHESSADTVSADQRIEQANKGHAIACLLLHASNGGHGLRLYTSALTPVRFTPDALADEPRAIQPWDTAQRAALAQSQRLANDISQALSGLRIPLVTGASSISPIDSLTCPAIALELAPLNANGDVNTPASDSAYQDRVAASIATALTFWRGHVVSTIAAEPGKTPAPDATKLKPKSAAKLPVNVPEDGGAPPTPAKPKVPIIRRPPPPVPDSTGGPQ